MIDRDSLSNMMTKLTKEVKSFSIAFAEKTFDESSHARIVAHKLGTDHHEEMCTPNDLLGLIPEIQSFLDEPMSDPSIVPTYALSKFTRKYVTVALGGDGGDELFAGYPTFQAEKLSKFYRLIPSFIKNGVIEPIIKRFPVSDENISFDFTMKYLLKKAVRDFLPKGIADRPKRGFGIPVAKWVKGPLKSAMQDLLHPTKIRREGYFRAEGVQRLIDDHLNSRADNSKKLWILLTFELWHDKWA